MMLDGMDILRSQGGGTGTAPNEYTFRPDRRKRPRTRLHWPLRLLKEGAQEEIETLTQNLSSGGFYCLSTATLTPGETVLCTFTVPAYDPRSADRTISIRCEPW